MYFITLKRALLLFISTNVMGGLSELGKSSIKAGGRNDC